MAGQGWRFSFSVSALRYRISRGEKSMKNEKSLLNLRAGKGENG